MQTEHRGHTIFFSEHNENWHVDDGDLEYRHISLSKVKEYINKYYKKKVKSVRAFKLHHREVSTLWVTSIDDKGHVWTKDSHGHRQKEWRNNDLFAFADPINRKVVPEIKKLMAHKDKLENLIEALKKKLTPF